MTSYVGRLIESGDEGRHLVAEMVAENGRLAGVKIHRRAKLEEAIQLRQDMLDAGAAEWPGLADKRTLEVKAS